MRPNPMAKAFFADEPQTSSPAGDRAMTHGAMTPMVSATIDTAALRHNLQVLRQWAPRSRVMAVIKANAYGHGLVAVARALKSADAFAVARVDEGMTLRRAGIGTRTVLLEGV
ncbi:MAG: alanine racemase, partial [Candidatus Binataceae bacterium]|nr:alanine racemase [Candidatus Binataceae bacterium]